MRGERDEVSRLLTAGLSPEGVEAVRHSLIAMKANVLGDLRSRPGDASPAAPPPTSDRRPARRQAPRSAAPSAFQQDRV